MAMKVGEAKVYLFGGYARGGWVKDSDVDLIVVSSRFKGMSRRERMSILRRMAPDTYAFEVLAYTPKEFEKRKHSTVIGDAIEYWVRIP